MTSPSVFTSLDAYVARCISLSEADFAYFHAQLTVKHYKKKSRLLSAGEICSFEGFITKGCCRVYYLNEKGNEVDLYFGIEEWWVSDMASFTQQKPSNLFIETLEDTELIIISYEAKERLFNRIPAFERMFRLMVQRTHETLMKRLISSFSEPAEERYLSFVAKYPSIVQRVPQHLIAAYLGITPEFLSKIRSKLKAKNL
jgi:CRP-like cAMP-binding protein